MASDQLVPARPDPLAMMRRLSKFVAVYEPPALLSPSPSPTNRHRGPETDTVPPAPDPRLVLLASWMDARDVNIAKYITRYQTLYPTAKILLIRYMFRHVVLPAEGTAAMQPALAYLLSQMGHYLTDEADMEKEDEDEDEDDGEDGGPSPTRQPPPEILIHVFSNGGIASSKNLFESFEQQTGRPFPRHAAIYDSCPGLYEYWSLYNAAMAGVRARGGALRVLAMASVVHMLDLLLYIAAVVLRRPYDIKTNGDYHNDPARARQAARAYIYGPNDRMIHWRHVELHSRQAEAQGYAVRREVFEGSSHVAHVRLDETRYWRIVTETWQQAIKS